MAVGHRRQSATWASAGLLLLALLLHVSMAQRPQSIADPGGGKQRQQQQLQLLLQQQQLQQQQQQQRGRFRQRARTPVVSDSGAAAAARQRVFSPSSRVSSLFNPAQRRQNNPLFRNRQRVSFLRPKTPPPPQVVTLPPRPPTTNPSEPATAVRTAVRTVVRATTMAAPPSPPPPPPPPPAPVETTFAYEEGVAHASKGESPTLVTLGKHDQSEDYSEALDELDDQVLLYLPTEILYMDDFTCARKCVRVKEMSQCI